MPLSGMLTCGTCGARTQMSTMRYNLNGSKLICQNCVDKERSAIKPGTTQSSARLQREQPQLRHVVKAATETADQPVEIRANKDLTGYYCRSCHYKFSRKKEMDVSTCPYCGRPTVSPQYTGGAQDLIEESVKPEHEMF